MEDLSERIVQVLQRGGVNLVVTNPCAKIQRLYNLVHETFQSIGLTKEEEGVGICAGAALSGAKPAMLIQSTGIGNMINALCSLTLTYQFPLLILASWRGVYNEKIPAQIPLGKRLPAILDSIGSQYTKISKPEDLTTLNEIVNHCYSQNSLHVVLLSPQLWQHEKTSDVTESALSYSKPHTKEIYRSEWVRKFTRFEILESITPLFVDQIVVSNIGFPSRELYHLKHRPKNFYMLGSLGLVSSIGLGLSLFTKRDVIVIDGDGSLLSNLGTLASIATSAPQNLTILAIDNGVHGSTGNQLTCSANVVDLGQVALSLGIENVFQTADRSELVKILSDLKPGPNFIHVLARAGNAQVPPIPLSPVDIKRKFMKAI
ncbi:MAG: sulfopyruvate decarboxylase subunit beta [Candidatus Hermodarchaeota archaeon]